MFRYILIDSSQHPRFHTKLQYGNALYRSLFDGHAEESLPDIAPLLIDVTADSDINRKIIEETTRIGRLKPCVSRLASTLPLLPLAAHFAQFHLIETFDGRSLLLRWYDTRILPAWLDLLTPAQRAAFTQPVAEWISLDRMGNEQPHPVGKASAGAPATRSIPLQLDEDQIVQLLAAAEPDTLIFVLRKTYAQLRGVPQHILYPFVLRHWRLARQHGAFQQHDQLQFLSLALHTSGAFLEHPDVKLLLGATSTASFSERLSAVPRSAETLGKPLWENLPRDELQTV